MNTCYWCDKKLPNDCLETRMKRILYWCSIEHIEKHLEVNTDVTDINVFRDAIFIGKLSELKTKFLCILKTEQPTKYDKSIDANCTLDEYVTSNYGGLPNEFMLEEQWNQLPPAIEGKPLRVRWMLQFPLTVSMTKPARFYMNRLTDVTGVSGTGKVLVGVVLPTGRVIIEWQSKPNQIAFYDSFADFYSVHAEKHPDSNEVVFID